MDKQNHPTFPYRPPSLLSLGQTDSQVVASSGKLNLRRDRQVSSQAHASRKCAQLKEDISYISLANDRLMDVTQLALTWLGQTVKNLLWLACKFDLDQSERKSSQVNASAPKAWLNGVTSILKFSTCVYLRLRLARALVLKWAKKISPTFANLWLLPV